MENMDNIATEVDNIEVNPENVNLDDNGEGIIDKTEEKNENLFNHENFEFDPEEEFHGYDVAKYSDLVKGNEELFEEGLAKAKELGFSQEQVDFMIEREIASRTPQEEVRTAAQIREELNKNLPTEVKRNYNAISSTLREVAGNDPILSNPEFQNEAMSNPIIVRLLNAFFSKNQTGRSVSPGMVKEHVQKSSTEAIEKEFENYLLSGGSSPKEFLKSKIANSMNPKELQEKFKQYLEY